MRARRRRRMIGAPDEQQTLLHGIVHHLGAELRQRRRRWLIRPGRAVPAPHAGAALAPPERAIAGRRVVRELQGLRRTRPRRRRDRDLHPVGAVELPEPHVAACRGGIDEHRTIARDVVGHGDLAIGRRHRRRRDLGPRQAVERPGLVHTRGPTEDDDAFAHGVVDHHVTAHRRRAGRRRQARQ
jgi:hypothetical protein